MTKLTFPIYVLIFFSFSCGRSDILQHNNSVFIDKICGLLYNQKTNVLTVNSEKAIVCKEALSFQASISNQNNLIQCKAGSDEFWVKKIIIIFKNEENVVVYLNNNLAVVEKGDKQISGEIITGDLREGTFTVEPNNHSGPCMNISN